MRDKHWTQRILTWWVLPIFALGIVGIWSAKSPDLHIGSAAFASEMSQAEFEQRVRAYLLEHPEVIGEALERLQTKQAEQGVAAAKATLKAHAAEVFHDPDSPVGGNPSGDVSLVEFFDYNCPYCKMMTPLISQAETADPQLRIVYKEFPILGSGSVLAAKAALAANKQGKYEVFHRALYQERGHVDEAQVLAVATAVGIDVGRMKADMQDKAIERQLEKNGALGQALQITGTPGFVIGEQVTTGAMDMKSLQSLIGSARNGNQPTK